MRARRIFGQLPQKPLLLWNDGPRIRRLYQKLEEADLNPGPPGKGRNVWTCFGAVLAGRATRTLPAAVYNVLTFEQLAWGPLAAAALVVTVPVLLLTIVIQKEIVVGLTHGGVKA